MISNREELKTYISCDTEARYGAPSISIKPGTNLNYRFMKVLRYYEYYSNTNTGLIGKVLLKYYRFMHYRLGLKLGFDIPINVFGKGLAIHHWGNIVVNSKAKVGEYCTLQQGVVIGFDGISDEKAPVIGSNVYIGAGAKIIGDITIADNCIIGANAVVTKSFLIPGTVLGGVPAHEIKRIQQEG